MSSVQPHSQTPSGGPNLGFSEDFYNNPTTPTLPVTVNSTHANQGTKYDKDVCSFEDFQKTDAFEQAKREFAHGIAFLIQFAKDNCSHANATQIQEHLTSFLEHLNKPNHFGRFESDIYGYTKEMFDLFCVQIEKEDIPLEARVKELEYLAFHLDKCGPAAASEIQRVVSNLSFTNDDVYKQAYQAHLQLVDASLQEFVRQLPEVIIAPGMEIHYVTEIKRYLGFPEALKLPSDPFLSLGTITQENIDQAYNAIKSKTGPSQVALLMAQTCLQSLQEKLSPSFTLEELGAALNEVGKQFGSIAQNTVANCDVVTGNLSLMTNPNLLARSFLPSLANFGARIQAPVQILGWQSSSSPNPPSSPSSLSSATSSLLDQTRSITVQDECIAYIEQSTGKVIEYTYVTKEDLEHLYEEVHAQRINAPNQSTLNALLFSAIDNAEPDELVSFKPKWLTHDKAVLDAFIRKCTPKELDLWVKNQIIHCTLDQKAQLLESFADHGNEAAFTAVLNSLTQVDRQAFLGKCHFAARIDQAVRNNNAHLLQQWLNLLKQTPKEHQENVWLSTSKTLAHILKTGSLLQAHTDYFKGLEQAKKDEIVNQSQIKTILEAKDGDNIPGLFWALERGHTQTIKTFLEVLPRLGLSAAQIKEILLAKNQNGVPGLFLALQNGHAQAVKAFLEALPRLKDLGITAKDIKDILLAKRPTDGTPGLFMALQHGHAQAVTSFLEALPVLNVFEVSSGDIKDILLAKDADGVPGLNLALQNGHTDTVREFLEALPRLKDLGITAKDIKDILLAKRDDDVPGLQMALQNGHAQAVTSFLEALPGLKDLGLTAKDIKEILLAKRADGVPGLFMALQEGHAQAVKAFLEALPVLNVFEVSSGDIKDILLAKDADGFPGLQMALKNGHAQAVTSFLEALPRLKDLGITAKDIKEILLAKRPTDGTPGLYFALQKGHAQAVTSFLEALPRLKDLGLTAKDIKDILLAKRPTDGTPGLYFALQNGHAQAVKAFLEALPGLNVFEVSSGDIKDILLAKDADGVPGLYMALQKGHAQAVKAFLDALPVLNVFEVSSEQIKEILLAKRADGISGLQMALQKGHAQAVTSFLEALPVLNVFEVSSGDIKDILLAKRADGTPGLYFALQEGHAQAVTSFLEALLGLKEAFTFTADQIQQIVEARTANNILGLARARELGHRDAVDAYKAALEKLGFEAKQIKALENGANGWCSIL